MIGAVSADGFVRLKKDGVEVCCLPAEPLADEAPRYERPFTAPAVPPPLTAADLKPLTSRPAQAVRDVLLSPSLSPKTWIYRQFDREVGAGTIFDGTFAGQLIEVGRADGRARHEELCAFFAEQPH